MRTSKSEEFPVEIIKIRLSTPVLARARCKKCGSFPTIYYVMYNGMTGWEPSRTQRMMYRRMKLRGIDKTRSITQISDFGQILKFKSYAPTYHKIRGDEFGAEYDFDIVEYLTCKCGQSRWAFSEKAAQHRPEIINRKARSFFPLEIEY